MDLDSVANCNICMDPYDSEIRPRCMPCGHSFCTACLNNSMSDGRLLCPHCQQPHRAYNANEFPISYGMEELISELRKAKLGAIPKGQAGNSIRPRRSGSKWLEVFLDEKNGLKKLIEECDGMQSEMHKYKAFLDQRAEHVEFIQKIQDLLNVNADIVKQIVAEEKCLTDALTDADELKQKAIGILTRYDSVSSTSDIITGSEEIVRSFEVLEEWKIRSRNQLPNANIIKRSERVVRETTAALCMLTTGDNDAEMIADGNLNSLPIMKIVALVRGEKKISVTDLQTMAPDIRLLLEKGLVYALQHKDGQRRYAKVCIQNDQVFLHRLQDTQPTGYPTTIQHIELTGSQRADSTMVFMDLSWEGSVRGRVHILLSPDTLLGRHFRILCSGELGPSYANSRFLGILNRGTDGEQVYAGDYDKGNGNGGAPLITGLRPMDQIYNRRCEGGVVWARYGDENGPKSAQFAISTINDFRGEYKRVFGQVTDGLEIVRAAAILDDIKKVKVDDCGIVLTF